jgi:hypothetical protein
MTIRRRKCKHCAWVGKPLRSWEERGRGCAQPKDFGVRHARKIRLHEQSGAGRLSSFVTGQTLPGAFKTAPFADIAILSVPALRELPLATAG